MKKELFSLFLVASLFVAGTTHAEIVEQVKNIKIPGGITADYDELEDRTIINYPIYSQFRGLAGKYSILSTSIIYDNTTQKAIPRVLFSLQTIEANPLPMYKLEAFIDASSAIIFIKNLESSQKYTHTFSSKEISKTFSVVEGLFTLNQVTIVREYETSQDPALIQFLADNLEAKSKIIIRFVNDTSGAQITQELSKGEAKKLFNIFELYKKLTK